ncbi:MAG TPA: metalloregulator ArsR/SmtB family transcription factor [Rudaea sp.]|jgi:DNA-binding transcriptional ArsR family regulator|uniref:ArsR/SmtB family transcription factor n=1 Tax=Rudaea sp. TaxID=2136325 RepID=UPI002F92B3C2
MKTKTMLAALAALAQETRLAIFRYLVEIGPDGAAVGSIGAALKVAPATLSFHLKELSHADLVVSRQDGRFVWYAANFATMNSVIAYLTENCCAGQSCSPDCAPVKTQSTRRRIRS